MDPSRHYLLDGSAAEIRDAVMLRWRQKEIFEGFKSIYWAPSVDSSCDPFRLGEQILAGDYDGE